MTRTTIADRVYSPISTSPSTGNESPRRLRVLLADDDQKIREYLCFFLQSEHEVVGEAADGLEVLRRIDELHPDILLLDISMPGLNGFKVARELRLRGTLVKIIFVTAHTEPAYLEEAKRIGVEGFVSKGRAPTELPVAIRQVCQGLKYISPELLKNQYHL